MELVSSSIDKQAGPVLRDSTMSTQVAVSNALSMSRVCACVREFVCVVLTVVGVK